MKKNSLLLLTLLATTQIVSNSTQRDPLKKDLPTMQEIGVGIKEFSKTPQAPLVGITAAIVITMHAAKSKIAAIKYKAARAAFLPLAIILVYYKIGENPEKQEKKKVKK